jgi:hypothetical protein
MTIFDQQNYGGELGTGHGVSIADDGCALCDVAMDIVNCYGINTDPNQLNTALINVGGFASNGQGDNDEIIWSALTKVYPNITLTFNNEYPSTPANMTIIDSQLASGNGVIIGVSFNHVADQEYPDHYVLLVSKNSNGTYQMLDPWYGDETTFDSRYAVNGMSVAQAILQAVSFTGPVMQGNYYKGIDVTNVNYRVSDTSDDRFGGSPSYNLSRIEVINETNQETIL